MIHIANKTYEVVIDHKNGWKPDAFKERYSEVLERYDYIVGDWGYNQLRLRGFFKDAHPKATKESSIATLQDYLNEYCNFGCAYFIIERIPSKHLPADQQQASEDSLYELDEQEQPELEIQQEQPQAQQSPRPQRHQQRHQEQQNNRQQRPQQNTNRKPHHNHQSKQQNQQVQQNQQTAAGKSAKPS